MADDKITEQLTSSDSKETDPKEASRTVDESKEKDHSQQEISSADDDLMDLLDSALQDFDKDKEAASISKASTEPVGINDQSKLSSQTSSPQLPRSRTDSTPATPPPSLADPFLAGMSESNLEALAVQFENMFAASAAQAGSASGASETTSTGAEQSFAEVLAQAASSLAQNAQDLESGGGPEAEMFRAAAEAAAAAGVPNAAEGADPLMPFMQQMMESLLTKEVLYPSLSDVKDKYPAWLDSHRASLPPSEIQRFERQLNIISNICSEYDQEKESDSKQEQTDRRQRILQFVQQLQSCGQPPDELIGDMSGALDFGAGFGGMPSGMPSPDQCCLM